jgi:alpha-mannosidase
MFQRPTPIIPLAISFSLWAIGVSAEVQVTTEQLRPASPIWAFQKIPGPSRSDIATGAKVTIVGNHLEPRGAEGSALVNGRLAADSLDLSEGVLFTNANADGGRILLDLGRLQPVAAVTSYSWHEWDMDGGSRAPQVYVLYGSAAEAPDPKDLSTWTRIAAVDTRPKKTGQAWNGQHGAFIHATDGKLGDFRHLLLDVQATHSPRQPNAGLTNTLFDEIDVHTAATLAKAGDAVVHQPPKVTDVWVVFKTHLDIGYTDSVENVKRKYREPMMEGALRVIESSRHLPADKRFSWTLGGWPLAHVLGPQQDPARRARIEQAVREGAIVPHALPCSFHTETDDLEDLVRGMNYASQIARKYGRPLPIAAKMTDVPCHSWVWPTLLQHAGVQFLHIGCNGSSMAIRVPPLFWWEGPDGSRILCGYTPEYGSGLFPPKNWPAHNYLAMIMTNDNQGPPSVADVENIRRVATQHLPGVRVHFGTLDDFARATLAEKPELQVVRGDMPDTWIHGWLSMPIEAKAARHFRAMEPVVDLLATELGAWGLAAGDVAPALAQAYEQSCLFSEHTFGPFGPIGGPWHAHVPGRYLYGDVWKAAYQSGAYKKYEQAFDDKRAYARTGDAIVRRELSGALELLARSVDQSGPRIVVFNALPWTRSGVIEDPAQPGKLIYVKDVPAGGYRTIAAAASGKALTAVSTPAASDTLDTPFYQVRFDRQRGGIASLVEKQSGRQLVDQASPYALGQFVHERFDHAQMLAFHQSYGRGGYTWYKGNLPPDTKYAALTPPAWDLAVQSSDVADVATFTARDTLGLAKGMTIAVTFYRQRPCVDVQWRVREKTPDPLPEGGWLSFPFAVTAPKFLVGRLAGPIDPTRDILPGGNRHYLCLNSGLTIRGSTPGGVGLCPLDSPCVSLGEPGLWKFSFDYEPKQATVFVNLYNNEWNTNFPEWQDGSWSNRVRFWPTTSGDVGASLTVPSWEARVPLLAVRGDGAAGTLAATQTGLSVSRPGVLVTAFGHDPDGHRGTLLRVWEQAGITGTVTVTLPPGFKAERAQPVDLRGEKIGAPLAIHDGRFEFPLSAYAPASFLVE